MRPVFSVIVLALCVGQFSLAQVDPRWKPNDPDRPVPPVIEAGTASTQDLPGRAPSDAVVLFDGKDLSRWMGEDSQPAKWKVADGYIEVVPHSGELSASAIRLFTDRSDQDWSLTDCLSFLIMGRRNIRDALTADHHFGQAGLRAVLSDNPPAL